ncbi:MAG TPA: WbqC family protein [Flavipsychrobacter sp.]|nr:WbqC family protein [Flavipsychrobacter sp.]
MIKTIITQSNYIPWKGYFDSIAHVDVFVVYDDMQYTKRDWRNRNVIKTPQGLKWLTIPVEVSGKYFQKIKDTRIADQKWQNSHWDTIKQNYKQAACFKEMAEWIEPLYRNCKFEYLTEVNLYFIQAINAFLGIQTAIRYSSEFELAEEKTQRLVNICKDLNATDYYSGAAAKAYMNESLFEKENIKVHYWDYSGYKEYPQLNPPFEHGVSILDLIFNTGNNAKQYLNGNP